MSDEDRDIEIESDDDDDDLGQSSDNTTGFSQAEKRAHHNALERKRRDHIKDSFTSLRDSVPLLQGEKVNSKVQSPNSCSTSAAARAKRADRGDAVSRAQILKKASEYILTMRRKNTTHQKDIDNLKRQNEQLENKIRILEKSMNGGTLPKQAGSLPVREPRYNRELSGSESSETEEKVAKRRKKLKS